MSTVRVVCVSDTHNQLQAIEVPDGDVLIHAGDGTMMGRQHEIDAFAQQLAKLPHAHKVVISGNHDWGFQLHPETSRRLIEQVGAHYLQEQEVTVAGLRVFGSPFTPWFHDWAFNAQRGSAIREHWDLIPDGLDFLVTHGPPLGVRDWVAGGRSVRAALQGLGRAPEGSMRVGCEELLEAVRAKKPRYHVFGHIHDGYGVGLAEGDVAECCESTTFVNASSVNEIYRPTGAPLVLDVEVIPRT